ncbi:hypothetical protein [Paenibacillus silvae]|uniref:hypothetical protein n=1 Tax=Paenibacillus silvae TaxID=1325358 RepID=UPI0025A28A1D|nr:hypothetical protein [Paenibacillus silvae]
MAQKFNVFTTENKYLQSEKNIVRKEALGRAIDILTINRDSSTIATLDYFDEVERFMLKDSSNPNDVLIANTLSEKDKFAWKKHYKSILGKKQSDELRVAYLSGPNPENDLNELIELGILPENVWAFESENDVYDEAVMNLLFTYPQMKIHKGKISSFFENSAIKFDIIYLDFCGTFFSSSKSNKNISTLISLLENHRLNSPGSLVTNYAYISDENDPEVKKLIAKVVALYLYPKAYADFGGSADEQGYDFYEWYNKVEGNVMNYYSEFIRRFMMDLTAVYVPFIRICKSEDYFKMFFNADDKRLELCNRNLFEYRWDDIDNDNREVSFKLEDDYGGHLAESMNHYSIPWFIDMSEVKNVNTLYEDEVTNDRSMLKDFFEEFYDERFRKTTKNMLTQIFQNNERYKSRFCAMLYMLISSEYGNECYSERLLRVYELDWNIYSIQACDVFTFQSVAGLLIGQMAVPYHINVNKSLGWQYKAKETIMMTDLFVLDECRYIYDMMPTIDMLPVRMTDLSPQICYRFALDALDKNHIRYNPEIFFGCAVVGVNHEGFEDRWFSERIIIE